MSRALKSLMIVGLVLLSTLSRFGLQPLAAPVPQSSNIELLGHLGAATDARGPSASRFTRGAELEPTDTPTTTATLIATATDTPTETPTSTATDTPRETSTSTVTDTPTEMPTSTATQSPTATPTSTSTYTRTPTRGTIRLYFPTLLRSFVSAIDPYEPNDTLPDAWGPLVSRKVYEGYFLTDADREDFYYFDVPSPGSTEAWLTAIPAGGDYDLYLYDQAGELLQYSPREGNSDEHLGPITLNPGRYCLRIKRVSGAAGLKPYQLLVVHQ